MTVASPVAAFLSQEARSLLMRLGGVKSFALQIPSVLAAGVSPQAQTAVENHMARGGRTLRRLVLAYLRWLHGPEGRNATPVEAQGRFTFLRLRFNSMLDKILSESEQRILCLIGEGLTDEEIGKKLRISPRTVQTHRHNILRKLRIGGTPKLIAFAMRHGFTTRNPPVNPGRWANSDEHGTEEHVARGA